MTLNIAPIFGAGNIPNTIPLDGNEFPTPRQVARAVAAYYGMTFAQIIGDVRDKDTTFVRHIAWYVAHKVTGQGFAQIARDFGRTRDHSSIAYGYRRIKDAIKRDLALKANIEALIGKLGGGNGS
jgi:chromosomal replication initiator protein